MLNALTANRCLLLGITIDNYVTLSKVWLSLPGFSRRVDRWTPARVASYVVGVHVANYYTDQVLEQSTTSKNIFLLSD